ncbi:GH92 family glycosyl hydrolase [Pedobacter sp. BMA]|uniref:GH92 family glycosyl hydrolase n=1 Tax=Pedobacter sp. BMA TaxID=1663685 RepID=UPI00064A06E6|nr:GH92 family glycosyl hydrolase [Pedobacter sp. BMA]KLT63793.1 alpha-mannosidase [Pedobacter sp. BMA]
MKLLTRYIFVVLSLMITQAVKSQNQKKNTLTNYVNPFIGTAPLTDPKILGYELPEGWRSWAGLCFPGSSLPNAMVQLSPITEYGSGAGYEYEDDVILGFAHTNKGHWNLCNVPVLPMSKPGTHFGSKFSHQKESASPGFYQVYLSDYQVNVNLTSTLRCGFHQYEFKDNQDRQVLFDLAKANSRVSDWNISQDGDYAVKGFQNGENVYFYAVSNTKIDRLEKKEEGKNSGYAILHLSDGQTRPVELKIGLSFVSVENARENLESEIGSKTFTQVKAAAATQWEKLLSAIQVKGGTSKQKVMLYSSLYRSFLWPALRSDVNGQFKDAKGQVTKSDFRYYTEPSLWDTYRNKDVLLGLITPDVTLDVIKSMIDVGQKRGFMPTFFHGDHGTSSVAGAYLRGIDQFDIKAAYQIFLKNANVEGGARPFIKEYIEKGYISDPDIKNPHVETKAKAGVSKTLEYAYDDYSLAQIAKKLGDSSNYRSLMARSGNYKNMFDPGTRFMRGRLENGNWIKPFNPQYPYYEYMYREANAWQVSFYAPHDMPGLIRLYGGAAGFESKLDSLFTLPWNPKYIARNVETMIGQYCQGNQPDHEAPFAYTFIGKPEKSQKIIDKILNELYGIGKEGLALSGMDDAGEMSSWYVFSALGIYPFSATDPNYIVTVPLFDEIKWKTSSGKLLIIKKPFIGRKLTAIKVNGKKIPGYFISHDVFRNGGTVEMVTE